LKLSKNFSLGEFLVSQTAERHGIDMDPPQYVIDNLAKLCVHVLQPIRDQVDSPLVISSGYRPTVLNQLIGGSKTSAHRHGQAADFRIVGLSPYDTVDLVLDMDLVYDQVIHEFGKWVHIGISETPRGEVLTAYREDGATHYMAGLHHTGGNHA